MESMTVADNVAVFAGRKIVAVICSLVSYLCTLRKPAYIAFVTQLYQVSINVIVSLVI